MRQELPPREHVCAGSWWVGLVAWQSTKASAVGAEGGGGEARDEVGEAGQARRGSSKRRPEGSKAAVQMASHFI